MNRFCLKIFQNRENHYFKLLKYFTLIMFYSNCNLINADLVTILLSDKYLINRYTRGGYMNDGCFNSTSAELSVSVGYLSGYMEYCCLRVFPSLLKLFKKNI